MDHFIIQEFVDKDVYKKYHERAWSFFDPRLLDTVSFLRKELNKPMTINNWHKGGQFSQRGLRHNLSQITKDQTFHNKIYLSAHTLGMAVDIDFTGIPANDARIWIYENSIKLPYKVRLEANVNWVHLDVMDYGQKEKIYLFDV